MDTRGEIVSATSPAALDANASVLQHSAASIPSSNGRHRLEQLDRFERLRPHLLVNFYGAAPTWWTTPWCFTQTRRVLDIVGASLLLALCSPVLLVAALAIKLTSPGPVFYRQWRTGFAGWRFQMYKLRTMVQDADHLKESLRALSHHGVNSPDFKVRNDPRITAVGKIFRKLSLDEVPNLINVIRGEMSLVGPRPTSFDIDVYSDHHLARLAVPPGITGLWQISGRSEIDFDQRVELDCRYIREQSFLLDVSIIAATPFRILSGRGAY